MELRDLGPAGQTVLEQVLGYLNFSSGAPDPQFLANLNQLFSLVEPPEKGKPAAGRPAAPWRTVVQWLQQGLEQLAGQSPAFQDTQQATAVSEPAAGPRAAGLPGIPPRPVVPPDRRHALRTVPAGPAVRSHPAAGCPVGGGRADHCAGDPPVERLCGLPSGGGAGVADLGALPARAGATGSAVRGGSRGGGGTLWPGRGIGVGDAASGRPADLAGRVFRPGRT